MNISLYRKAKSEDLLEGPLSEKEPLLLIILKEPHAQVHDYFWMRDSVLKLRKGTRKYFNVLGAFAKKILCADSKKDALESCAYINLYPENGGANISGGGFEKMIKYWKDQKADSEMQSLINERLEIIKDALESGVSIMTHPQIAQLIARDFGLLQVDDYAGNKKYCCYDYKNGTAKVYCICHPASRINYTTLGSELGCGKSIGEIE